MPTDATDAYEVMDLEALRCFWAMAKHGSLTQAGIELGISELGPSILDPCGRRRIGKIQGRIAVELEYWLRHAGLVWWWRVGRV